MSVLPERFWAKVARGDGCWEWQAGRSGVGYGMFYLDGGMHSAHRLAYIAEVGPIPDGLELDHLCRVRHCVNPAHLQPVTHAVNMARGAQALKTHCPQGHPYDAENTRHRPGHGRSCRTCDRAAGNRKGRAA